MADTPEVLARFHAELDLVELIARQLSRRIARAAVTVDDLRSFGREGLLHAARTFDRSRGVPFRRWANMRIKGAMMDGVRQWTALPRGIYRQLRAAQAADLQLAEYDQEDAANPARAPESADERLSHYLAGMATAIAIGTMTASARDGAESDGFDVTPEHLYATEELMARVKRIIASLPPQERMLVERHYFDGQTLDEASASIGLSKSWGSRLHARAIDAISRKLRKGGDL